MGSSALDGVRWAVPTNDARAKRRISRSLSANTSAVTDTEEKMTSEQLTMTIQHLQRTVDLLKEENEKLQAKADESLSWAQDLEEENQRLNERIKKMEQSWKKMCTPILWRMQHEVDKSGKFKMLRHFTGLKTLEEADSIVQYLHIRQGKKNSTPLNVYYSRESLYHAQ